MYPLMEFVQAYHGGARKNWDIGIDDSTSRLQYEARQQMVGQTPS